MSKNKIFSIFIVAFLIGVFVAPNFPFSDLVLFLTFLLLLFLTFIFRKNLLVRLVSFSAIFLIFGVWRFFYAIPDVSPKVLSFYNNQQVEILGFISGYPQEKDQSETFEVRALKIKVKNEWQNISGKVYISVLRDEKFIYGQNIKLKGVLESPKNTEDFNFASFFASRGIYSQLRSPEIGIEKGNSGNILFKTLFSLRKSFEEEVGQVFVEPFASLILGINLGVKRISKELLDIFNKVSISHIIVISGYNISIISDFFKKILQRFSRRLSFWLPFLGILFFTILVGAEPPVVRAAIMGSVLLLARNKGRKVNGVFALLFAAFLMIIFNPLLLDFDPGFQLSFLSTLGLILISDKILSLLKKIKIPYVLAEALSSTLAAQIFIMPLIIFYFGRLSIISPLANVLILPLLPFIMFSSFFITILGFLSLGLARFLASLPVLSLSYLLNVSTFLSKLPFAFLEVRKSAFFIYFYYLVLALPYVLRIFSKKKVISLKPSSKENAKVS